MTPEERSLLLRDICARLPYGVKFATKYANHKDIIYELIAVNKDNETVETIKGILWDIEDVKPYLRPMSSMTKEEEFYIEQKWNADNYGDIAAYASGEASEAEVELSDIVGFQDWLNEHHFDYRKLIKKGLALEAPEGMYND